MKKIALYVVLAVGFFMNSSTDCAYSFIIRARYGVPGKEVDVTQQAKKYANKRPGIKVSQMGLGDPAPGERKILTIEYRDAWDEDQVEMYTEDELYPG